MSICFFNKKRFVLLILISIAHCCERIILTVFKCRRYFTSFSCCNDKFLYTK